MGLGLEDDLEIVEMSPASEGKVAKLTSRSGCEVMRAWLVAKSTFARPCSAFDMKSTVLLRPGHLEGFSCPVSLVAFPENNTATIPNMTASKRKRPCLNIAMENEKEA